MPPSNLRPPSIVLPDRALPLGIGVALLLAASPASASVAGGAANLMIGFATVAWAAVSARVPFAAEEMAFVAVGGTAIGAAGIGWRRWLPLLRRGWSSGAGGGRRLGLRCRSAAGTASPPEPTATADASFAIAASCRAALAAVPPGFDREAFLDTMRERFRGLQAAWDAADAAALRDLTTPALLDELLGLLEARGHAPNRTDVLALDAELLGIEAFGSGYLASVEFSGLIRESAEQGAEPFRELWMLACPKDDPGAWRLARQQVSL